MPYAINNKTHGAKALNKSPRFSRFQVGLFIATFALIGGYFIWHSFAASPLVASLQAEQMILPNGSTIVTDSAAVGGKVVKMSLNGSLTGSVNFPSKVTSVTVVARASSCNGSPYFALFVDGSNLLSSTTVSSSSLKSYSANTALSSGNHTLRINTGNIGSSANSHKDCSRTLYLDITNFYGTAPPPTPAPTVVLGVSPTAVSAGQSSTLTWNSTNATSCTASGAWSGPEPVSGNVTTGALNSTASYTLSCTGAGGNAQASATVSVSGGSSYLFDDEFNGSTGAQPDASKWILHDEKCDPPTAYSCPKHSNVFQDGSGHLVLRTQRESSNYLSGGPYSGAWVSTFNYGYGWPPTSVKASFPVPFHIEMSALMPETPGGWPAFWPMNVDKTSAQGINELDVAEERMTNPTVAGCHQHYWVNGTDQKSWDGSLTVADMGQNSHVYSADVYSDHVDYQVDGQKCGTASGAGGKFGIVLDNAIGSPGSWGSGGGQPASSDPGPWDFLVDYIRVSAL